MRLFLSCAQTAALLSDNAEGILETTQRWRLRLHLSRCADCRALDATLRTVSKLAAVTLSEAPAPTPAEAQRALQLALANLGQPRRNLLPEGPVPERLRPLLEHADAPLRLLQLAHRTLSSVVPRETSPVLPEEVASELPPPEQWRWQEHRGMRMAELLRDPSTGARLALLFAPPGHRIPPHRHRGTESLLLLDGEMTDTRGQYETGDLVHLEEGSLHAPVMGDEGCWCLVRETGEMHYEGPLGWLRNWLAA